MRLGSALLQKRVYALDPRFVLKRVYGQDPRFRRRAFVRYAFVRYAFVRYVTGSRCASPPMVGETLASVPVVVSSFVGVCPSSLCGHHGFSSSLRSVDSFGIADANNSIIRGCEIKTHVGQYRMSTKLIF